MQLLSNSVHGCRVRARGSPNGAVESSSNRVSTRLPSTRVAFPTSHRATVKIVRWGCEPAWMVSSASKCVASISQSPKLGKNDAMGSAWDSNSQRNPTMHLTKSSPSSSFSLSASSSSSQNITSESNGEQNSSETPSFAQSFQSFPWKRLLSRFVERVGNLIWTALRIVFIPTFLICTLGELSYAIRFQKLAWVLAGLLIGTAITAVSSDTYREFFPQHAKKETPWHLIVLGLFFCILKLSSPLLQIPSWAKVLIPQISNGGLWQVGLSYFQLKKEEDKSKRLK